MNELVMINCPLCGSGVNDSWGQENGYTCVRCSSCGLLYVNPRPAPGRLATAVELGCHELEDGKILHTRTKPRSAKKKQLSRVVRSFFSDLLQSERSIRWLDIGAGYGEFVAVLQSVLPPGSTILGIEPMQHKVRYAERYSIPLKAGYIQDVDGTYDVVSLIDVFSHIPNFSDFLIQVKRRMRPNAEIFIKTGNAADIGPRKFFPGPLNLPDHLVFSGISQLTRFLSEAGFTATRVRSQRVDGVCYSVKNAAKWILGRPVFLAIPYSSPTRTIWLRAKLMTSDVSGEVME